MRDLNSKILNVIDINKDSYNSSLEEYLLSFLSVLENKNALSLETLIDLVSDAFHTAPLKVEKVWLENTDKIVKVRAENSFDAFKNILISQIVDLHMMNENGDLDNKFKYFGIDSPLGNRAT